MNLSEITSYQLVARGTEKIVYRNGDIVYKLIESKNSSLDQLNRRENYLKNILRDSYQIEILGCLESKWLVVKQKYAAKVYVDDIESKVENLFNSQNFIQIKSFFYLYKILCQNNANITSSMSEQIAELKCKNSIGSGRFCFINVDDMTIVSDIKQSNVTECDSKIFIYDCTVNFLNDRD